MSYITISFLVDFDSSILFKEKEQERIAKEKSLEEVAKLKAQLEKLKTQ